MKKFYILTNITKDSDLKVTNRIAEFLEHRGCSCSHGAARDAYKSRKPDIDAECIIVLGGDGTLLRAARDFVDLQIPLIGINLGNLGFLAEISLDNFEPSLEKLIEGNVIIEKRMMLTGTVFHEDREILTDCALNDIVISKDMRQRLIRTNTYINDSKLTSMNSDGLIVSTPTGSTGYSLSLGGPIISPEAQTFLITPMAPHTLVNRSVIIPPESRIVIELTSKDGARADALVSFDGDTNITISTGDRVCIQRAEKDTRIARISDSSFMDVLRKKMNQ